MQAAVPPSWIPSIILLAQTPLNRGSSEKLSNPRPPRGDRCVFAVGPRITWAPFAFASFDINCPAWCSSSASNVAARAVPHGKHAEGIELKKRVPRIPLGPSDKRIEGILSRGIEFVCQKSRPDFQ